MTTTNTTTEATARYRCVVARRPFSPSLLGVLIGKFVVAPIIGRRGITVSPEGVTVHGVFRSRPVAFVDIAAVQRRSSRMQGDRLVLELRTGEQVSLPAPTSQTIGDVGEAKARIEAFL